MPSGRVAEGVLEQVEDQPVELVGVPLDRQRAVDTSTSSLRPAGERLDLVEGGAGDLGEVGLGAGRAPAGVGAGEQQQVGDQARHAPGRAQGRVDRVAVLAAARAMPASSSRLAWTLVSGVRSSCEASATNSRWRSNARSRSARASSSASSIPSIVRASSPTSSSAAGTGIRREGSRVAVISRARAVRRAIGRIARSATASPASSASTVPPSTPAARKSQSRPMLSRRRPRRARRTGRRRWSPPP